MLSLKGRVQLPPFGSGVGAFRTEGARSPSGNNQGHPLVRRFWVLSSRCNFISARAVSTAGIAP